MKKATVDTLLDYTDENDNNDYGDVDGDDVLVEQKENRERGGEMEKVTSTLCKV